MTLLNIPILGVPDVINDSLIKLSESYEFSHENRKGANGYVFIGLNTILQRYEAIKYIYWGGDNKHYAEPKELASLDSPNIIEVFDAQRLDDDYVLFKTPFCKKGDLGKLLETEYINPHRAISFIMDILQGLVALHSKNLIHRDLKPANIFLGDEGELLIGDFGSVRKLPEGSDSLKASGHSLIYRPPESIGTNSYGKTGDLYQVGMLLYQFLGGYLSYDEIVYLKKNKSKYGKYKSIFDATDKRLYVDGIIKDMIQKSKILDLTSLPVWISPNMKRLINRACNISPEKRISAASDFMIELSKVKKTVKDWRRDEKDYVLEGELSFKITPGDSKGEYNVMKKRRGNWKYDYSFSKANLQTQIEAVEQKV